MVSSRIPFGKFKGRLYQEAETDAEVQSWLEWLTESSNEKSSRMGRWYLAQLASVAGLEDAVFLDLENNGDADGSDHGGLVVFRHPGLDHYQRLVEAARSRLADLELEYGVENSKVVSVRSKLFGALRPSYQERDRLRLLIQYRRGSAHALACGFQRPR